MICSGGYKIDDYYYENSKKPNIADIIIARNKFGDTGTIELLFNKMSLRYVNFKVNDV